MEAKWWETLTSYSTSIRLWQFFFKRFSILCVKFAIIQILWAVGKLDNKKSQKVLVNYKTYWGRLKQDMSKFAINGNILPSSHIIS